MKNIITIIISFNCFTLSFGQSQNIKLMVDSLRYLEADTLDCRANLYWRIISKGEKAIPFLIDKLSDTTQSNVSFACKSARLNVGEISYFALNQIGYFPAFTITHIQFDYTDDNGCWIFYEYLFNNENKTKYQTLVKEWFARNQSKFHRQKIRKKKQSPCQKHYGINTYLKWRE